MFGSMRLIAHRQKQTFMDYGVVILQKSGIQIGCTNSCSNVHSLRAMSHTHFSIQEQVQSQHLAARVFCLFCIHTMTPEVISHWDHDSLLFYLTEQLTFGLEYGESRFE